MCEYKWTLCMGWASSHRPAAALRKGCESETGHHLERSFGASLVIDRLFVLGSTVIYNRERIIVIHVRLVSI